MPAHFMILEKQVRNSKAQEYLKLQHQEELEKLHHRFQHSSTMVAPIAMPPQATPSTLAVMTSFPCATIPLPIMTSTPLDSFVDIATHIINSLAIGSTIFSNSYIDMLSTDE
jgi:small neutral amino acid transporter SnatA (MarC family)